jgi:hypothetical protein
VKYPLAFLVLAGCGSAATDARIEAFGYAEKGQLDRAATSVSRCAQVADDAERFGCSDLLAAIRMRQGLLTEAAMAYRDAFSIRDRIAKREGYGPPDADSLHQWGYALLRTGHAREAEGVLERARLSATMPDEQLVLAAIDLELAEIATANNQAPRAKSLAGEASKHACHVDELDFFGKAEALEMQFFPHDVWLAVAAACPSPNEAAQIRARAGMLPSP